MYYIPLCMTDASRWVLTNNNKIIIYLVNVIVEFSDCCWSVKTENLQKKEVIIFYYNQRHSPNKRGSLSFFCVGPGILISEVERHIYFQFPVTQIRLPKLGYSYVELAVTGTEPWTFRLQGDCSTKLPLPLPLG